MLTAAHVLDGESGRYSAGELAVAGERDRRHDVTAVIPIGDRDLDVAAVIAPGADGDAGTAVIAAAVDGEEPLPNCSITGYPRAGADERRAWPEYLGVSVLPVSGRGRGRLALHLSTSRARSDQGWAGLSGAAVLTRHRRLLGIVTAVAARWESRFHAVPITRIRAALREAGPVDDRLKPLADLPVPAAPDDPLFDGSRLSAPLTDLRGESLFDILHFRHRTVPFVADAARQRVLDDMLARIREVGDDPDLKVLTLTGPAGSGKSRLAAELCDRLADGDPRWRAGFADYDRLADAPQSTVPLVLFCDYPERAPAAIGEFIAAHWRAHKDRTLAAAVRVVLVSRHAEPETGWLKRVGRAATNLDQLIADRRFALDAAGFGVAEREQHARAALKAYGDGPEPRPDVDLAAAHLDRPLLVHAAALLAAKGLTLPSSQDGATDRLLDLLIDAEVDRLLAHRTETGSAVFDDGDEVREALCVTTLTAPSRSTLPELLRVGDYFADAPNARRHRVARVLESAYPGGHRRPTPGAPAEAHVAPVEPDLIAAHLLATTDSRTRIVDALTVSQVVADNPGHLARLLEALALAADDYPEVAADLRARLSDSLSTLVGSAPEPLGRLLERQLPGLLDSAVRLAAEQDPAAGRVLAAALSLPELAEHPGIDERAAETVARLRLPHPQPALTGLGVVLAARAVAHWERRDTPMAGSEGALLAAARRNHGVWLRSNGNKREALAVTRRSVADCEVLVRAEGTIHLPSLARSLNNLAIDENAAGRGYEAARTAQRVVEIREELAETDSTASAADLFKAYANLGVYLQATHRPEAAVELARRSVAKLAELAAADPAHYRAVLGTATHNLGAVEAASPAHAGRALDTTRRAVTLRRDLAARDRVVHLPELAQSLGNLAVQSSARSRHAEAHEAAREAVALLEELAADDRRRYLPDLALAALNLATRLAHAESADAALHAFRYADRLRDELERSDPTTRTEALLTVAHGSVDFFRLLVRQDRDTHLPGLTEQLQRLATAQAAAGLDFAALRTASSAAELIGERELGVPAAKHPNPGPRAIEPFADLQRRGADESGSTYFSLPTTLARAGSTDAAIRTARRGLELAAALAETDRARHLSQYAMAASELTFALARSGELAQCVPHSRLAISLHEELVDSGHGDHLERLAYDVNDLSFYLAEAGQPEAAFASAERAIELFTKLSDRSSRHRGLLANAIWSAAEVREQLGLDLDTALRLTDRAVGIFESLSSPTAVDRNRLPQIREFRSRLLARLTS